MSTNWYDFSSSLGYLTVTSARLFAAATNRALAEAGVGLTAEQWAMLQTLVNEDGRTQDELLRFTRYEKSSLSRLLDGMERKGLIRRERGASDARKRNVFITGKGREQGKIGTELNREVLKILYSGIDEGDLDTCREVLEHIQNGLLRILRKEEI